MNINSIYLFTNKSSFFWRAAGGVDVVCKGVGEKGLTKMAAQSWKTFVPSKPKPIIFKHTVSWAFPPLRSFIYFFFGSNAIKIRLIIGKVVGQICYLQWLGWIILRA